MVGELPEHATGPGAGPPQDVRVEGGAGRRHHAGQARPDEGATDTEPGRHDGRGDRGERSPRHLRRVQVQSLRLVLLRHMQQPKVG